MDAIGVSDIKISAVVKRANGKKEDLGVIAEIKQGKKKKEVK